MRRFIVLGSLAGMILGAQAARALTVRVDPAGGAPRILADGKPVRARMFWGAPGPARLSITPTAQELTFEFSALESEPKTATMHFRFGQIPGDVFLDDIRVTDLDDGREVLPLCDFEGGPQSFSRDWTTWPTGEQNTVGQVAVEAGVGRNGTAGLHVGLKAPPDGQWPDWHIYHLPNLTLAKDHRYRISLWVRAEPARSLTIAFYRPGQTFVYLGGPPGPFESQIRLAADVDVNFISFPIPCPWPQPGQEPDWSGVDAVCRGVLAANPEALLLPRFGLDPPPWWRKAHSDEVMTWEDGSQKSGAVVASPQYRRDAAERARALVTHLEETLSEHVAGYHPCGQNTGEWFYHDTWGPKLNGYAPADVRAWRQWLAQRYPDDTALREAWGDPTASRDAATVPTAAARHAAPFGVLRDPIRERPLIDFSEFQQQAMAELVCELARAVREASGGRKLVVFFYGYVFEFGAIQNGPATSGHYALRRALDCPDIDVLCSPISYFDRGLGQSGPVMTAAESVALADKMWLCEDDTSTHLSTGTPPGSRERVATLAETNALLVRNVAQEALRNFGTWWMDLTASGWFNDPAMWGEMRRMEAMDRYLLDTPTPFRPQVAAVIDERVMPFVAAGGTVVTRPVIYEVRKPLGRMGAPYGQYLMDDIMAGKVSARLFVFLNAWRLSAMERNRLLAATRGSARIWCYAPGYLEEYQTNTEAMQELTGFKLDKVSPPQAWAEPTEEGRRRGLQAGFGIDRQVSPLFAAVDAAQDEVLARYPDGAAAVAARQTPDGLSLFVGPPGLTSELLRLAAREAGVHLYTQVDCNVYANSPFVAVHASQDGPLEVDMGRDRPVRDALTGELVGVGPRLRLDLRRGETRVFRY